MYILSPLKCVIIGTRAVLLLFICCCVSIGKYGVQKDRMDKSAVGHDYQADLSKHVSQTDAAKGFGG